MPKLVKFSSLSTVNDMKKITYFHTAEWYKCKLTGKLYVLYRIGKYDRGMVRSILSIEFDSSGGVTRVEDEDSLYIKYSVENNSQKVGKSVAHS